MSIEMRDMESIASLAAALLDLALKRQQRQQSSVVYDFAADEAFLLVQRALAQAAEAPSSPFPRTMLRAGLQTLGRTAIGAPQRRFIDAVAKILERTTNDAIP